MFSRLLLSSSALLVVSVGLVRASISLSSGCQSTLISIATSSEASCLNVAGLTGLFTATANSSLVSPINTWLAGACAQSPCSNQTLSDVVSNITSGCGDDLSSIGLSNSSNTDLVSIVQAAYPTVRQIACLKDTTNNTLCVNTLLTDIQNVQGTLSLDTIFSTLSEVALGQAANLPSYITCSDCVKQAYNVLQSDQAAAVSQTNVSNAFQSQCGSSFTDGKSPSEIVEGTGSAAPTGTASTTSGAAAFISRDMLTGIALSSLGAVFSAFLVLA